MQTVLITLDHFTVTVKKGLMAMAHFVMVRMCDDHTLGMNFNVIQLRFEN